MGWPWTNTVGTPSPSVRRKKVADAVDVDARLLDPAHRGRQHMLAAVSSTRPFKRPRRARVRAIRDRLRELYGRPEALPHDEPIEELVRTVLSQNTNDRNRDVAYDRLRERFPTWDEVRDAPLDEVEDAIRPGGLATQGAADPGDPRGSSTATTCNGCATRRATRRSPFSSNCPASGRKTAACVLIFSFGRPEIPVDTHVERVGKRLGLISPSASFDQAHDEMRAIVDPEDAWELHINLIAHGRAVCRPQPRCDECALLRMCPHGRKLRKDAASR